MRGASHAVVSAIPWLNSLAPSWRRGSRWPGPPVPTKSRNCPFGAAGICSARRTSNEITRTFAPAATSVSRSSSAASSTACTSESWPTFGQAWFMSRMATSTRSGDGPGCAPSAYSKKSYCSWMSRIAAESGKGDAVLRFLDDEVDDVAEVAALLVRGELAVGAGAALHDLAGVVDLLAGAEAVDHVVDELEQLVEELAERHLRALAEVDQLPVDPEA